MQLIIFYFTYLFYSVFCLASFLFSLFNCICKQIISCNIHFREIKRQLKWFLCFTLIYSEVELAPNNLPQSYKS